MAGTAKPIRWLLTLHLLASSASAYMPGCPAAKLTVVYNLLIWPDNDWEMLLVGQVTHLISTGITQCAAVHVALSAPAIHPSLAYQDVEGLMARARQLLLAHLHGKLADGRYHVVISQSHENSFEYPGLHLLWLLAQQLEGASADNHLMLYFHAKGMMARQGRLTGRLKVEEALFRGTIEPWREIAEVFDKNKTVTRVGMWPSHAGWVWYNFWWARGSYIKDRPEPVRTRRRDYYVDWLGRVADIATDHWEEPGRFSDCSTCCAFRFNQSRCGVGWERPGGPG